MDMDIDTKVLNTIQNDLRTCEKLLSGASSDLTNSVSSAGENLEGRQYTLAVQETEASCKIIDASATNLSILAEYLSRLEADVNAYLKCKYRG